MQEATNARTCKDAKCSFEFILTFLEWISHFQMRSNNPTPDLENDILPPSPAGLLFDTFFFTMVEILLLAKRMDDHGVH